METTQKKMLLVTIQLFKKKNVLSILSNCTKADITSYF